MSVGNTKNQGSKGNNFSWQLAMLKAFNSLISLFSSPFSTIGTAGSSVTSFEKSQGTTGYIAKDVIHINSLNYLKFPDVGSAANKNGYITKAIITTNNITPTNRLRLHLFNEKGGYVVADNDPFKLLYAETSYLGYIDFPALATGGSGSTASFTQRDDLRFYFESSADNSIYFMLETLDAFTPTDKQQFRLELSLEKY
jgi:hypothetical protein